MGRIEVTPEEVSRVGADIAALGPAISALQCSAGSVGRAISDPPATAAALGRLGAEWAAGAERLQDDVVELGRMTQGAAVLYLETDRSAMGMGAS